MFSVQALTLTPYRLSTRTPAASMLSQFGESDALSGLTSDSTSAAKESDTVSYSLPLVR